MSAPRIDEAGWVDAIVRELDMDRGAARRRPPDRRDDLLRRRHAVADAAALGRRACSIRSRGSGALANDVEITLEANPASADAARFADYRAAGVNRAVAGRAGAERCRSESAGPPAQCGGSQGGAGAGDAEFRPRFAGSDLCAARSERRAMAQRTETRRWPSAPIICRSINSPSSRRRRSRCCTRTASCKFPDEDLAAGLYETTQEIDAKRRACPAYEISNHARPGSESRHNLIYWRYGDYAGVGPGAHGRLIWTASASRPPRRLPERWRDTVTQGRPRLRRFRRDRRRGRRARASADEFAPGGRHRSCGLSSALERRARRARKRSRALVEQGLLRQDGDCSARHAARPPGAERGDRRRLLELESLRSAGRSSAPG